MGQFQYSFPGEPKIDPLLIAACGLQGVIDCDKYVSPLCKTPGPGAEGILVGPNPDVKLWDYSTEGQTWQKCLAGKFWVGFRNDDRPTPKDLKRAITVRGYAIELEDGNVWSIPACQVHDDDETDTYLPQAIKLDADGNRVLAVVPRHLALRDMAAQVFELFTETFEQDAEERQSELYEGDIAWEASVAALSTNYLVTQWEISALGLLTTTNQAAIMASMIDWPVYVKTHGAIMNAQKKTDAAGTDAGSSTDDGEKD